MAKGYWVVQISVTDPETYQRYREAVGAALAPFGGRFLVRAGAQEVTEGTARPRTVVLEFPDYRAALDCYHSAAYQQAKAIRLAASEADFTIVEGFDG
ncbi:MAG: DUF1330 domain-containing protein [Rhodobacteraceae bacterium]|nr:MAG: DUF1330 domain-containing protein [Paracoccaceae bacterium]